MKSFCGPIVLCHYPAFKLPPTRAVWITCLWVFLCVSSLTHAKTEETRININAASSALMAATLIGIGPTKATAIVRYREKHGAFKVVDDLVNVKGIGEKTLDKIRDSIVAGRYRKPAIGKSLADKERQAKQAVQAVLQHAHQQSLAVD